LCLHKTRANIQRLADEPKAAPWAVDGDYFRHPEGFYEIGNWTSSFFTGMALLAWRDTEDEYFLRQVLRLAPHYREKVFTRWLDTHHDLGFLYMLYSVALYKLTGMPPHREVGLRAAEALAQRFNRNGNFIRAWGHLGTAEFEDMAIIDSLMNLPLLYWASLETGDGEYRGFAIRHADAVLKNFFRPDGSVYHAYRFDLQTGQALHGDNYGGCGVESQWARGTAWAAYGFALSFGYTQDARYLEAAARLAHFFANRLDQEAVSLWDFRPGMGAPLIRDASAAAIMVCAFQELEKHRRAEPLVLRAKQALLDRLCSEDYLNFKTGCPGIQRNGQVGNGQPGGAQNAYTSWGDYFLMEALARELNRAGTFW
jgi:unsaturated chondroitin disaccharide hydrolase